MSELIAMQNDLGLGHKGDILLTTQERFDSNQEAIAKDIIDKDYAERIIHRYNAFEPGGIVEELKVACEVGLDSIKALLEIDNIKLNGKNKKSLKKAIKFVEAALAKS